MLLGTALLFFIAGVGELTLAVALTVGVSFLLRGLGELLLGGPGARPSLTSQPTRTAGRPRGSGPPSATSPLTSAGRP